VPFYLARHSAISMRITSPAAAISNAQSHIESIWRIRGRAQPPMLSERVVPLSSPKHKGLLV
jgi:hypothetical protein